MRDSTWIAAAETFLGSIRCGMSNIQAIGDIHAALTFLSQGALDRGMNLRLSSFVSLGNHPDLQDYVLCVMTLLI